MSRVKKFVIYNIMVSSILVGSLYSLSWLWINYVDDASVKFLELEKNKNIQNLKIINLGSSHAFYGIEYPLDMKAYNMALSSQIFYYDFEILRKYHKKLSKNAIVLIPISIFSFYTDYNKKYFTINYTSFLEKERLEEIKSEEYFLGKNFSITQPITRIFRIFQYIFGNIENKKLRKNFITYKKDLSIKEKKEIAKEIVNFHLGISSDKFSNNDKYKVTYKLKEILNFCDQNDFVPILISTPMTYLYNEQLNENIYYERIYNNIEEIEKELGKKYLYLDYSHDERFSNNLNLFIDCDHLNKEGAKHFTKILLNDIEGYGYKVR